MLDQLKGLDADQLEELALEARRRREELLRERFPIQTKMYLHGDKGSNWDKNSELNLTDKQMETFAYAGYEVEFDIEVDETGQAWALSVNGSPLVKRVKF